MGTFQQNKWRKKKNVRRFFQFVGRFYERVRIKRKGVVLERAQDGREAFDVVINTTHQTEQHDTYHANAEGCIAIAIVFEGRERVVIGIDVHRLHDEQVVVERDHRVDLSHEYQPVPTGVEGGHEDKELREEAGKRGNTGEREQAQRHDEGLFRIRAVESVVIVHGNRTGVLFH